MFFRRRPNRWRPYNSLRRLPPRFNFDDIDILKKVNTANKAVSELNGLIRSLENPEMILEPLRVKEAVESSGIENIQTTMSEALQAELFTVQKLSAEQKETKNYKQALLYGFEQLLAHEQLTVADIIVMQELLGVERVGLRDEPGTVIGNRRTRQIYYTPPSGRRVLERLMKNFEQYYNDAEIDPDYLIKMAILHYQFEAIHPFFDGNGRTGRILMVLYLVAHDCLVSPTLFISRYINQHKGEYYRLLRRVTFQQEWKPWILFILDAVETQATATNAVVLDIIELKEKFKTEIMPQFNFTYTQELLTYIFSNAFYTQKNLRENTPVKSNKTALEYLHALEDIGILRVAETDSREKVYYFHEFLQLLE